MESVEIAPTGSWQFKLKSTQKGGPDRQEIWYLVLVQGKIVFTGREPLVWSSFSDTLKRYIFRLREAKTKETILNLEKQASPEQLQQLGKMLTQMEKTGLVTHEEVVKAVQTQILSQFDHYLFQSAGIAQFTANQNLVFQAQIPGFKLEDLFARATQRRIEWRALLPDIPSMECEGTLNDAAFQRSNLTEEQKRHIKMVISRGKTFEEIAYNLAKDPLEIAKLFAKLSRSGLVKIGVPAETKETSSVPGIFVVDDSPVLLQQFESLVVSWGYRVKSCLNPLSAVGQMLEYKPALIFLDINMPGVSGFDLIKQIRRETQLSSIPLVLLTAEKSVSNQWRAQWASCKFLAKPSAKEEVPKFRTELMEILRSDAPIQKIV